MRPHSHRGPLWVFAFATLLAGCCRLNSWRTSSSAAICATTSNSQTTSWALHALGAKTIYFTAGIVEEEHGLFGAIKAGKIKGLLVPTTLRPLRSAAPRQRSQLHSFQLELCRPRMPVRSNTWHRLSNYCLRASSSSCRSPCWPHGAGSGLRVDNARSRGDNAGPPADHATPRARDATLPVHDDEREKRSPPSEACCGASALPYGNVTTLLPYSERSLRTNVNEKRFCWLPAHLPPLPELVLLTQLVFRSELAWTQSPSFWR